MAEIVIPETLIQSVIGLILILSSLGVILTKKPVYAGLFFLLTLLSLSALYLQLSAQFIAAMQILVYAGAILVVFMFVIVLFQDAHEQLSKVKPQSLTSLLWVAAAFLVLSFLLMGHDFIGLSKKGVLPKDYGTVQSLGTALFIDFFFPFEAVIMLFLIAVVGAVYIGRKET